MTGQVAIKCSENDVNFRNDIMFMKTLKVAWQYYFYLLLVWEMNRACISLLDRFKEKVSGIRVEWKKLP